MDDYFGAKWVSTEPNSETSHEAERSPEAIWRWVFFHEGLRYGPTSRETARITRTGNPQITFFKVVYRREICVALKSGQLQINGPCLNELLLSFRNEPAASGQHVCKIRKVREHPESLENQPSTGNTDGKGNIIEDWAIRSQAPNIAAIDHGEGSTTRHESVPDFNKFGA